jgi:hypothetical protein
MKLIETGIPGEAQSVWDGVIAFHRASHRAFHPTIRFYDTRTNSVVNTKVAGMFPSIFENTIAFVTSEKLIVQDLNSDGDMTDNVIRYHNIDTGETFNTGQAGNHAIIHDGRIVFSQARRVMYFDVESQTTFATNQMGTEPDIYGDTITYYLWEGWSANDINLDGDLSDPIVRTHHISRIDRALQNVRLTDAAIINSSNTRPLLSAIKVSYSASSGPLNFRIDSQNIEAIQVQVFDLSGRMIFNSPFSTGRSLAWSGLNANGQRAANGVYLYTITVRGFNDQIRRSSIHKLVIMR